MTTFAPTFTPRWKGTYVAASVQHTLQLRGPRGASFSTMDGYRDRAREVFDALHGDLCSDFAWVSAEVALTDSDVFLPATTPTVGMAGTNSLSDYSPIDKISALTLSGRTDEGRSRFSIFGLLFLGSTPGDIGADGLVTTAEVAGLSSVIGTANTYFYGNSGQLAVWHNRATFKPNDHLLKLVRRGIIS
jgi:hypothetical protein